jgi:hypothetical protein
MPRVPLITAGDPEAAAREEGEVTSALGDEAGVAEDTTAPTTEGERADGASGPAAEVDRAEAAEETVPPAPTSAGAAPGVESMPVPVEAIAVVATTEEDTGQTLRRRSLRPRCWPSPLPGARVLRSPQPPRQVKPPMQPPRQVKPLSQPPRQVKPLSSPKELRSEEDQA